MNYRLNTMTQALSLRNIRMRVEMEDPLLYGHKKLKIRGRDLVHLPKEIFKLMDLEVLDMSPDRETCLNYKLTMLPGEIGRLFNLTTLLLDTNDLLQVPAEITLLLNLERLTLSNNYLSELPKGVHRLKKMTSLHLANNKFDNFPIEICGMTSLVFLDVSDNLIKILPQKIGQLKSLQTLLLLFNQLTKLPDTIVNLTELRCLWLGNNRIRVLPKGFGYLTKLDWSNRYISSALDGNPLVSPPLEICRLGPEAIEKFQGVGPNIDAEKKAKEEMKRKGRRTIPLQDSNHSISGNEFNKDSSVTWKSQQFGKKSSSTNNSKMTNRVKAQQISDTGRK